MPDIDQENLVPKLAEAFEAFKDAHKQELAELKKGSADYVTTDKLSKIDERLNVLSEIQDRLATMEKRANRPGVGHNGGPELDREMELKSFNLSAKSHAAIHGRAAPSELSADAYGEYKAGFAAFLRSGRDGLGETERKAMSVGSDPDGGYLVTPDMTGRIITRVYETSPMRQICSVQPISTDALEGVIDRDEAGAMVMVGEATSPTETATPQVGTWRIPVWEGAVEPKVTQRLLDDAAIDVEAWLAGKIADKISRGQNAYFVTGTGANQPRGLTAYPTAATPDASRAFGTFEHVATGVSGAFAASNPADHLFDLIGAFKDAYLQSARWLTRREVITLVRKFKESTTGNYLWQPGLQQGQPQTILGFPVTIAQDMPTLASGSLSLGFGDFAKAYQIVDRMGMRTVRDNLTLKPYVKFWTAVRFGGGALDFEAAKFIKFGA